MEGYEFATFGYSSGTEGQSCHEQKGEPVVVTVFGPILPKLPIHPIHRLVCSTRKNCVYCVYCEKQKHINTVLPNLFVAFNSINWLEYFRSNLTIITCPLQQVQIHIFLFLIFLALTSMFGTSSTTNSANR